MLEHGLQDQAVEIKAIDMKTDYRSTFDTNSSIDLIGGDMAK